MGIRNEAAIKRRIAKAERRIARGIDLRKEAGGEVSERYIAMRLRQQLEGGK